MTKWQLPLILQIPIIGLACIVYGLYKIFCPYRYESLEELGKWLNK